MKCEEKRKMILMIEVADELEYEIMSAVVKDWLDKEEYLDENYNTDIYLLTKEKVEKEDFENEE